MTQKTIAMVMMMMVMVMTVLGRTGIGIETADVRRETVFLLPKALHVQKILQSV